ncbi:MAG TPA: hypothetical protein VFY39_03355, partial [Gammaproteobacteria bacterium]|nr:hypothetical protein [Gammaproteobacteria bacterium]
MTQSGTAARRGTLPSSSSIKGVMSALVRQGPVGAARLLWIYLATLGMAALQPLRVSLWLRVKGRADGWAARFR